MKKYLSIFLLVVLSVVLSRTLLKKNNLKKDAAKSVDSFSKNPLLNGPCGLDLCELPGLKDKIYHRLVSSDGTLKIIFSLKPLLSKDQSANEASRLFLEEFEKQNFSVPEGVVRVYVEGIVEKNNTPVIRIQSLTTPEHFKTYLNIDSPNTSDFEEYFKTSIF